MCVVVTCEVAHRLQFEGLQDGFKRSHLDVHLLVDLHVVVIQVWLLMMSSSKQRWNQQQPVRRQNLQMLSGCRICSVHLPCGETLRWLPSAFSPVQWTDKRNTKWASLQLSSCACKHHFTLFTHTQTRAPCRRFCCSPGWCPVWFPLELSESPPEQEHGESAQPHENSVPTSIARSHAAPQPRHFVSPEVCFLAAPALASFSIKRNTMWLQRQRSKPESQKICKLKLNKKKNNNNLQV